MIEKHKQKLCLIQESKIIRSLNKEHNFITDGRHRPKIGMVSVDTLYGCESRLYLARIIVVT